MAAFANEDNGVFGDELAVVARQRRVSRRLRTSAAIRDADPVGGNNEGDQITPKRKMRLFAEA